jgi:hypothetical protein
VSFSFFKTILTFCKSNPKNFFHRRNGADRTAEQKQLCHLQIAQFEEMVAVAIVERAFDRQVALTRPMRQSKEGVENRR